MRVNDTAIQSFIKLYSKKYGVTLSEKEAMEKACNLLKLIEVVEFNSSIKST